MTTVQPYVGKDWQKGTNLVFKLLLNCGEGKVTALDDCVLSINGNITVLKHDIPLQPLCITLKDCGSSLEKGHAQLRLNADIDDNASYHIDKETIVIDGTIRDKKVKVTSCRDKKKQQRAKITVKYGKYPKVKPEVCPK